MGSSFQQEHDEDDGAVWLQERHPRDLTRPFPAETYRNVRYLAAFEGESASDCGTIAI